LYNGKVFCGEHKPKKAIQVSSPEELAVIIEEDYRRQEAEAEAEAEAEERARWEEMMLEEEEAQREYEEGGINWPRWP